MESMEVVPALVGTRSKHPEIPVWVDRSPGMGNQPRVAHVVFDSDVIAAASGDYRCIMPHCSANRIEDTQPLTGLGLGVLINAVGLRPLFAEGVVEISPCRLRSRRCIFPGNCLAYRFI